MAVVLLFSCFSTNIICNVSQLFIEITYQFVLTWYSRHFQLAGITVLLNKGLKINRYAIVSIVTRQFSTHRMFTTILSLYVYSFSLRTNLCSWQIIHKTSGWLIQYKYIQLPTHYCTVILQNTASLFFLLYIDRDRRYGRIFPVQERAHSLSPNSVRPSDSSFPSTSSGTMMSLKGGGQFDSFGLFQWILRKIHQHSINSEKEL